MEDIRKHNLILENRNIMNITGVNDVTQFSDEKIVLSTEMGVLDIEGDSLHINSFVQETSELRMEGNIDALIYHDKPAEKNGLLSRLFR